MLTELLLEKNVKSSWITDISHNRSKNIVRMTLNNGRQYYIYDIKRTEFEKWHRAPSKGKYWHSDIAGFYDVKRVS